MTWLASRGLLRRALRRPVGPSSSARAVATDAGVVPAAARKYSRPQVQPPLNAKKARGLDILNDPLWNKGTAFSVAERDRLGLKGLLPPVVKTIEEQRDGFLRKMREQRDPVDQNLLLWGLHDRNETLFHRVLVDCIDECAPRWWNFSGGGEAARRGAGGLGGLWGGGGGAGGVGGGGGGGGEGNRGGVRGGLGHRFAAAWVRVRAAFGDG